MSASGLRGGLGRASAGESEACQRRDRHGADADERRSGVGVAVGEEVAGAGARGEDQAADGAAQGVPDAADGGAPIRAWRRPSGGFWRTSGTVRSAARPRAMRASSAPAWSAYGGSSRVIRDIGAPVEFVRNSKRAWMLVFRIMKRKEGHADTAPRNTGSWIDDRPSDHGRDGPFRPSVGAAHSLGAACGSARRPRAPCPVRRTVIQRPLPAASRTHVKRDHRPLSRRLRAHSPGGQHSVTPYNRSTNGRSPGRRGKSRTIRILRSHEGGAGGGRGSGRRSGTRITALR